ncbi:transposase [Hydrogenimonas cancrithermarum]|uniref:Transposase n=1 Tax=Hydrogenimonas cancrithermarum TaxID=2993563 RepID=A0ABN6WZU1_9BACT|nr:transposase [Hydrogenimonas cancrithermarum]BDY13950.1 transposase [Hydrogenimonas cancrithermarum]
MPRIARGETVGGIYHVINRGNMRMRIFDDDEDYNYFLDLLETAKKREPVRVHAYCLLPNHFHLMLVPQKEGGLSRFMQWVMTSHVRYYHKKNKTSGHVWQGRFKSFIVQQESYYLTLMRYIEANAKRAGLVDDAGVWRYGSLYERIHKSRSLLDETYLDLGDGWHDFVNEPIYAAELEKIRNSVNRQAPLGTPEWQKQTAAELGLLSTLNRRGRPKKKKEE